MIDWITTTAMNLTPLQIGGLMLVGVLFGIFLVLEFLIGMFK